jgi:hypothetical protein
MKSSWQSQTGNLACRWSDVAAQRVQYNPPWMQETSDAPSSYLPPLPDFASHSPFGGGEPWFQLHPADRDDD